MNCTKLHLLLCVINTNLQGNFFVDSSLHFKSLSCLLYFNLRSLVFWTCSPFTYNSFGLVLSYVDTQTESCSALDILIFSHNCFSLHFSSFRRNLHLQLKTPEFQSGNLYAVTHRQSQS